MKKLMVAIAAAAISLAGVAGTWFEAGFGESATSTGGAWLTDGDVTAPTFEGETLVLEDVEAPVVFAADEAKTPADGDIEVSTVLSFQGFQELPEIDPDAKAGVCALEGGNFWVVGYDAVGATNQWFDTGIAAVIGESVNVGVTVTNAVAGYQIGDSIPFEVPTRAEEIREVCYLGNGSVTALGADYTEEESPYAAQIGDVQYETLQEALTAAAAATDSAKTVLLMKDVTVPDGVTFAMANKNVILDLNGKVLTSDITVTAPENSTLVFTIKNAKGDPTVGKIVGDITQTNGKLTISRSSTQDVIVEGSLVLDNVADASIQGSVVQTDSEKAAITAKGEKTLVKISNTAVIDAAGVAVDAQAGTVKVLSNSSTSMSVVAGTIEKGEGAAVTITGGEFTSDPSGLLGAEYAAVKDGDTWIVAKAVAKIDDKGYPSLAAAVDAVAEDAAATITLLTDVELLEGVAVDGKDITFDLNAKTVTFTGCSGFYFLGCDGAVTNGTVTMDVPATAGSLFAINFENGNGLVKDVVVNAGNCKYGVVSSYDDGDYNDTTVVCENVDVSGSGMLFYAESQAMTLDENCSATQSGENAAGAVYSDALAAGWNGQLTVNGGTYTAEGNVIATMSSPAVIKLNGGTFSGAVAITPVDPGYAEMGDHIIVKDVAVELAAPEGYKWNSDGLLVKATYVAEIGTDKYETLDDAVEAVAEGAAATIRILDDLELLQSVEVEGKDITFDLNAKTVKFDGCSGFYFLGCDGAVTNGTVTMDVPDTAGSLFAINFEKGNGLVKDVVVNAGNCKYGVISSFDDDNFNDATVVCENVDVSGSGMLFYAESQKMTLDADCLATQSGENAAGAVHSDALAAGWLGELTVNGGEYTAEGNVIATMSSPATITLNDGSFDGAVTITPVDPGYAEMGEHVITKAEAVELAAPEGYKWDKADESGMQKLVEGTFMFFIGETGYDSWADVATVLKDGDVVKIGENAIIGLGNEGKKFTLDLCGNELEWESKGWLFGSLTFTDSVGGGVLTLDVNNRNVSNGTLDLSTLAAEQIAGPGKFWTSADTLIKFPSDMPLDTCTPYLANKANGQKIVVQGVTYVYDSAKGWVPDGCYFITITAPENGTLETSVTNAVPAGTTVTVTATPADAYQLVSITTNGEAIAGAEFVMPEEDVTVAATFEAVQQSVKITLPVGTPAGYVVSNVTDGVAIDGDTSLPGGAEYELPFGAKIEIWAVPAEGFRVTGENPYVIEEVTSETAVELEDLPSVEEIPYAAQIGDQKFETLQEALNEGGKVVMLADCTETVVVPSGVEVTLDFNGYKIDVNGWAIKNCGTLTIDDGLVNAREAAITMYGDSVTTINGGTFTSADNAVIMGQGSEVNGNVTLTVNGGEFNGGIVTPGYVACGVYAANSGVYAINGGTFKIVNGCGICARAGQVTVGDEAVINVSGEIEGKVGDKNVNIPCVALYVDRTEPPYPGYVAETDYLKATSNTLKIDELNQFWVAEADGTYSLHDDSEAVATVNEGYYLTVEAAFAALQAAEAEGVKVIESLCLAKDGIEFQFEGQSVSLAWMELLTIKDDMWLFKNFPFAGHVTLLPGKTIVAKGLADGATIDVPTGYVLDAAEPDPAGYIAYTAVPDVPAWDIVGGEGGINALVKEDGVTKYVEFTSITLTETGATVGLKAAKIDANGAEFALICKTALTDTETFSLPATLNYEKGELGDATEGLFTITADLSGYKQLFVVGVGPKTPAN